ncbi:MAG: hypothetical protein ABIT36_06835 [Steroidobacteraceae bacterium]
MQLPLWIEEPGLRVVHACWHPPAIEVLTPLATPMYLLPARVHEAGARKGNQEFLAVESLCKGLEVPLPAGCSFLDKDGKERLETRIRWWERDLLTYRQAAIGPAELTACVPDLPFPEALRPAPNTGRPVFIRH